MNEENALDHNVGDAVDRPVVCVSRDEVVLALNENWKSQQYCMEVKHCA